VALLAALLLCPFAAAAGPEKARLVVVLYPEGNDGRPGNLLVDQSIRSTFAAGCPEPVEVCNEYLDVSRFPAPGDQRHLAEFLRRKYAGRKVDLVIACVASALTFALGHRDALFPGVPIVFCVVDRRELGGRKLGPKVVGVPVRVDLAGTLDLAVRLHPGTRRVVVVAGKAKADAYWEAEARQAFRPYEGRLEFTYLTGLPLDDLLGEVARLPAGSVVYYLHVCQDGAGKVFAPADVVERLAAAANAPVYGHLDTFLGRGVVGGRVVSFQAEGAKAARLALRVLAGEAPDAIAAPEAGENTPHFDWRQLRRWGIREEGLPRGSVVLHKEPGLWDLYKWHVIGVSSLCLVEALLIAGLLVQRADRRRAEQGLRASQLELRLLTGKLLEAQEAERRRIARELHDDLNQSLALLSVEMDLLGRQPPVPAAGLGGRLQELSARVKQLSSSVHDLSHQLHPSKLEQLGLVAAVRGLCQEQTQAHGLPVKFTSHQLPGAIPEDTALCLYRIAQEALRNVVKHSGARSAEVELSGSAGGLCLRVADDGAGFDPRRVQGKGGLGLVSMRERLHLIGGEVAVDSPPSGGTRIQVRVPLGADGPVRPAAAG
jgi:signal transduction histidine kinase